MQRRLPKYNRAAHSLPSKSLTPRSIAILDVVFRYKLVPTSIIIALVGGNEDVTHRHLQRLYHLGLVGRFSLGQHARSSEFLYYIDSSDALDLLAENDFSSAPREVISSRPKKYRTWTSHSDGEERLGRLLYAQHELVISRFHFMLEAATKKANSKLRLRQWKQGSDIWAGGVNPEPGSNSMPCRPDALFSLLLPDEPHGRQTVNFFYEADRKRMNATRMAQKMKNYFEFFVSERFRGICGINKVRAVLVETTDSEWAMSLRRAALNANVDADCVPLFWFTSSEVFSTRDKSGIPRYLRRPEVVLERVWLSTVDEELLSVDNNWS
jgi:hypothetical protein